MSEEEIQVQENTQEESADSLDYKALYLEEVQNAKKQRHRAQEAESTIQDYAKKQEAQKVSSMKEKEQFKELSEELQKQVEGLTPFKERWDNHELEMRESYLAKLPEEDREALQGESLKSLKYIADQIVESKPTPLPSAPNQARVKGDVSSWNVFDKLTQGDLKDNWGDVINSYKEQHKKL